MRRIPARAWLLALLSALLQILIFPEPSLPFFCWIALVPLLLAVLGPRREGMALLGRSGGDPAVPTPARGFCLGYLCGILWYLGTCYWVFHVMHVYGGLDPAVSAGLLVLFALYLGLYHGVFGLLLAWVARASGPRRALLAAPFLWVAVELARARITGFPWDLLGTVEVGNIPLTRIATITGVYGLSFEIALVNAAFAAAYYVAAARRRRLLAVSLLAAVVLQAGSLLRLPPSPADRAALLLQQNAPILDSWPPEYYEATLREFVGASLQPIAGGRKADLIVWPESPAPFFLSDPRFVQAVEQVAERSQVWVIAGGIGVKPVEPTGGGRPYKLLNSAVLVSPAGAVAGRYDKLHLVPFGEYVPFQSLLTFASKLTKETGDFVPGSERVVLDAGGRPVGVFICYEAVFPDEVRLLARDGAGVFVNISNDGWFGPTGAPGQHLDMARMRAIESGRWLLRATNTGITASVDPYGRVVARAPRNIRTAFAAPYALSSGVTFYARHGDWFAFACAIIAMAALLIRAPAHPGRTN